ncbi:hypothetical protein ACRAWD_30385 [Caulobacter segnis]
MPRQLDLCLTSLVAAFGLAVTAQAGPPAKVRPRVVAEDARPRPSPTTYFDAAKGQKIAEDLRADARRGAFDAKTDPRDLATTLSDRLRPLDHHFNVEFSPPTAAASSPGPEARRTPVGTSIRNGARLTASARSRSWAATWVISICGCSPTSRLASPTNRPARPSRPPFAWSRRPTR